MVTQCGVVADCEATSLSTVTVSTVKSRSPPQGMPLIGIAPQTEIVYLSISPCVRVRGAF